MLRKSTIFFWLGSFFFAQGIVPVPCMRWAMHSPASGGHVVTVPEPALRNLDELTALFKRHRVTWVETLPSVFAATVDFLEHASL